MFTPEDQAEIVRIVAPLLERTLADTVTVAARATAVPTWRPATCVAVSGAVASVVTDEPGATPIDAGVIGEAPVAGSRVMAIFVPPGAVFCFAMTSQIVGPTTYAPTVDQGATANITNTANEARFVLNGPLCEFWLDLAIGGAGTAGSSVFIDLPVPAVGYIGAAHFGEALYYDASTTTRYHGGFELITANQVGISADGVFAGLWGNTPNLAAASGDVIRGHGTYLWR